jgi:hypothetical protein
VRDDYRRFSEDRWNKDRRGLGNIVYRKSSMSQSAQGAGVVSAFYIVRMKVHYCDEAGQDNQQNAKQCPSAAR